LTTVWPRVSPTFEAPVARVAAMPPTPRRVHGHAQVGREPVGVLRPGSAAAAVGSAAGWPAAGGAAGPGRDRSAGARHSGQRPRAPFNRGRRASARGRSSAWPGRAAGDRHNRPSRARGAPPVAAGRCPGLRSPVPPGCSASPQLTQTWAGTDGTHILNQHRRRLPEGQEHQARPPRRRSHRSPGPADALLLGTRRGLGHQHGRGSDHVENSPALLRAAFPWPTDATNRLILTINAHKILHADGLTEHSSTEQRAEN